MSSAPRSVSPGSQTMPDTNSKSNWSWLPKALVLMLVILLGAYITGFFLSDDYSAEVMLEFEKPWREVWAVLQDHETVPVTGRDSTILPQDTEENSNANRAPGQPPTKTWIEDMGSSRIVITSTVYAEQKVIERRLVDDDIPMNADVRLVLEPIDEESCRLRMSSKIRFRSGTWQVPLFRVMLSFVGGAEQGLLDYAWRVGESQELKSKPIVVRDR